MREGVDAYENNSRNSENPREDIFAHDVLQMSEVAQSAQRVCRSPSAVFDACCRKNALLRPECLVGRRQSGAARVADRCGEVLSELRRSASRRSPVGINPFLHRLELSDELGRVRTARPWDAGKQSGVLGRSQKPPGRGGQRGSVAGGSVARRMASVADRCGKPLA